MINSVFLIQLAVRVNKGKDFNGETIEINAMGDPSTLTVFSVEDFDLYKRKSHKVNIFFTEHMVGAATFSSSYMLH